MHRPRVRLVLVASETLAALASLCHAQCPAPTDGFDFATIGAIGNPAWVGPDPFGLVHGRGRVDYEYRIARMEVTTSQWMEFLNTFSSDPGLIAPGGPRLLRGPGVWWGGVRDPSYGGPGIRWMLNPGIPQAGLVPVNGISWRDAALYCNWLNNGEPTQWSAIQKGAYDTSTFTLNPDGTFNDQLTRSPGARFWIPSLDEWLKAAHYDPDRNGPGQGGWWQYSHSSDTPPLSGVPGVGQTSANVLLPNFGELNIPLGAYPDVRSPWGLLDTSGGMNEWLEESYERIWRGFDGTQAGEPFDPDLDAAWLIGSERPYFDGRGLRIASAVPAPATLWVGAGLVWLASRRRHPLARSCSERARCRAHR